MLRNIAAGKVAVGPFFIFIFLYPLYYTTYNTTRAASRL